MIFKKNGAGQSILQSDSSEYGRSSGTGKFRKTSNWYRGEHGTSNYRYKGTGIVMQGCISIDEKDATELYRILHKIMDSIKSPDK